MNQTPKVTLNMKDVFECLIDGRITESEARFYPEMGFISKKAFEKICALVKHPFAKTIRDAISNEDTDTLAEYVVDESTQMIYALCVTG